jgi:hypothetical protein
MIRIPIFLFAHFPFHLYLFHIHLISLSNFSLLLIFIDIIYRKNKQHYFILLFYCFFDIISIILSIILVRTQNLQGLLLPRRIKYIYRQLYIHPTI